MCVCVCVCVCLFSAGSTAGRCRNQPVALLGGRMESLARSEHVHVRVCAFALPSVGFELCFVSLERVDGLPHRVTLPVASAPKRTLDLRIRYRSANPSDIDRACSTRAPLIKMLYISHKCCRGSPECGQLLISHRVLVNRKCTPQIQQVAHQLFHWQCGAFQRHEFLSLEATSPIHADDRRKLSCPVFPVLMHPVASIAHQE